jgi:hypothetical protein
MNARFAAARRGILRGHLDAVADDAEVGEQPIDRLHFSRGRDVLAPGSAVQESGDAAHPIRVAAE